MWSLCHPSLRWGGDENGKNKAKLVGQGKGSLTEQQMKRTVTTIILLRRIDKANSRNAWSNSHCPMPHTLLSHN